MIVTEKANQALTKRHNARFVLRVIYDHYPISRANIARNTNLTATTVSTVINELINEGLVEEVGSVSTERGKPPTLLSLVKDARQVIALNLAQQSLHGGLFNLRGELLFQHSIPAAGLQGEAVLNAVYSMLDALLLQVSKPLLGIGIGAPGIIELAGGTISRSVNLAWYDLPLAKLLSQRYQLPIHIVNDNQASLLAEQLFGRYKNSANLVVLRVGRGVGAGLMVNGQLIHGYAVGEIGHVMVVENGECCTCGGFGCLETVVSNRSIVEKARRLLPSHPNSHLARLATTAEPLDIQLDIQTVIQAYKSGDHFLGVLLQEVAYYLGGAIANIVGLLGTPQILLCGGVMGFGPALLQLIKDEVARRTLTGQLRPALIDFANLDSDIIMLGATALLLKNELGLF